MSEPLAPSGSRGVTARLHDPDRRGFYSDNHSGIHPDVLAAIAAANEGHQPAYGADVYTAQLQEVVTDQFGAGSEAYPVFNGTGANVLGLQSMLPRWGGVVCATSAHVNTDENGAPERVGGLKLLAVDAPDGKLTPELVDRQAWGWGDEHRAQPLAVSITQSTELGTVYTVDEIRALADHARRAGMSLHMDGSRLSNAAASLGVSLQALTRDAGVDVVSFGGTKNGLMLGECLVALRPEVTDGLTFLRKVDMQLASKMRFVSAQLVALLSDDLWRRNAEHANAMARELRSSIAQRVPRVAFAHPTQANAVFVIVDATVIERFASSHSFETWDREGTIIRLMCSFDTTVDDIEDLVSSWERAVAD